MGVNEHTDLSAFYNIHYFECLYGDRGNTICNKPHIVCRRAIFNWVPKVIWDFIFYVLFRFHGDCSTISTNQIKNWNQSCHGHLCFPALPEVSLLRVLIGFSFLRLAVAIALVLVLRHSIAQCSIICHINIESRQPRYRSFVTDLSRSQHVTYKLYHQALSDIIWTERSSEVWFHGKCNVWSNEGLKKVMNYISSLFFGILSEGKIVFFFDVNLSTFAFYCEPEVESLTWLPMRSNISPTNLLMKWWHRFLKMTLFVKLTV